jgi:PAS domain S-box-containing protein
LDADRDAVRAAQASGDAVIWISAGGTITFWNEAVERLFGYSRNEALASSLNLLIPERHRKAHWTRFRQITGTGDKRYAGRTLKTTGVHQLNYVIPVPFTASLASYPHKGMQALVATVRLDFDE